MKNVFNNLVVGLLFSINLLGQPTFNWAKGGGGSSSADETYGVVVDASGNVYSTGSYSGTVDFDPSAGVYTITAAGSIDGYIRKLDASGNFIWAKSFGGTGVDVSRAIALDLLGNIYLTGEFANTADFDPNIGTYTLTSNGVQDIFVNKLDPNGNFVWAKTVGAGGSDFGRAINIDGSGNVCTTGEFSGTVDFDPGVSTYTLAGLGQNIYISKLDASGNFVWAKSFVDNGNDSGNSIASDLIGNLYITGHFTGTPDFDPGAGTYTVASLGSTDIFISKIDATGNFLWAKTMGGVNSEDGSGIKVDALGNVYTTGYFSNTVDFDPGATTFNLVSLGGQDAYVQKLNSLGNFIWAVKMGSAGTEQGLAICLDNSGNVYTSGFYQNTVDFNPGAGFYNLTSAGSNDIYMQKLDVSGVFMWAVSVGDVGFDVSRAINSNVIGNVYLGGTFQNTVLGMTSFGGSLDFCVIKYADCLVAPAKPATVSGATVLCAGSSNVYSVTPVTGANVYVWSLPSGWAGSSTTNTISATSGTINGIISVSASNACGTSPQQTLNVTINPQPTITVNSGSICNGQSFTMTPTGANTYTFSTGSAIVSPTSTTSYSVTGTSSSGCVGSNTAVASVTVNSIPVASASATQSLTCINTTATLNGSGVSTYTWSGPGIVSGGNSATPIANLPGTYSLVGTTSGCVSNIATVSLTSNTIAPTVSANTSNSIICGPPYQGTATVTASGASTYTWNTSATTSTIAVSPSVTTQYTVTGTSTINGCTNSIVFTQSVSLCTGINEQTANTEPIIYPNPTAGLLNIKAKTGLQIYVYNIIGELIITKELKTDTIELDLSNQTNGIYFVRIGSVARKIIKE